MRWSPWSATRRGRADDGAAAVEFAIVSGLLFLLLFAIIGFGILFAQDLALSNGARQAARAGAVPATGTCADMIAVLRSGARTIALDPTDVVMEVTRLDTSVDPMSVTYESDNQCPGNQTTGPFSDREPCAVDLPGATLKVEARLPADLVIPIGGAVTLDLMSEGVYRCEFDVEQSP